LGAKWKTKNSKNISLNAVFCFLGKSLQAFQDESEFGHARTLSCRFVMDNSRSPELTTARFFKKIVDFHVLIL